MDYDHWKLKSDRDDEPDFPKYGEPCERCDSTIHWQGISYEWVENGIDTPHHKFTFKCTNGILDLDANEISECGEEADLD